MVVFKMAGMAVIKDLRDNILRLIKNIPIHSVYLLFFAGPVFCYISAYNTMMKDYQPPFSITPHIVRLIADISENLGRLSAQQTQENQLKLRRINRIRTIQGSLAIEGNTLSIDAITAILDGKKVIAPPRDLQEARNAISTYDQFEQWQPVNEKHLLKAHQMLMKGLIDDTGYYRSSGVGVMNGDRVVHMGPPANRVGKLMHELLHWLSETDQHPLITSSVFHYEFEFIHPFSDGNGRMAPMANANPYPMEPYFFTCTR